MSPDFDSTIFRRYDIRGVADTQISPALAYAVGRALGTRIHRRGGTRAVVGRDVRHSSSRLAREACRGISESGIEAIDLGVAPTPVVYHALHRLDLDGALIVTGSHNPRSDNGLKLCLGKDALFGEQVEDLRTQIESDDFVSGSGRVVSRSYLAEYLDDVCSRFSFRKPLQIAVDCGNGVMGPVVLEAFKRCGLHTVPLYCDHDGDFPNHLPDPEVPEYMAVLGRTVVEEGADCGLGFDGDGDRLGVMDETGAKISADWLVALFAREMLKKYPGGKVRYDVKCSDFLERDVRAHGGEPIMGETGHSLLKRDLKLSQAILGGELSGHIVFNRDYLPIDDSLYCALFFLSLLEKAGATASELFRSFPRWVSTPEIKVPCADVAKFDVVNSVAALLASRYDVITIDGVRVRLKSDAWFLVRASNTTPNLTVRVEARTLEDLEEARDIVASSLEGFDAVETAVLHDAIRR